MPDAHPIQPGACQQADQGPALQRVSLIKRVDQGEHRWNFQWASGEEAQLISCVAGLARDPSTPFDWYDAAVVCRHIAGPARAPSAQH